MRRTVKSPLGRCGKGCADLPLKCLHACLMEPLKKLTTTQVEDSKLYLGDYSQMYVGIRNEVRIDFSKEASDTSDSAFSQMQIWVRAFMRADVVAAHEDHFTLLSTIT